MFSHLLFQIQVKNLFLQLLANYVVSKLDFEELKLIDSRLVNLTTFIIFLNFETNKR
jgi:hypothetical protein